MWIRHHRYLDRLLTRLVGYRRTFPTFQQAEVYASHFQFVGHQLFHLAPVAAELRRVFDLGGSVGNLFYSLSRELKFSHDLDWVVYDLPLMRKEGSSLAEARHEYRPRFTDTLAAASGSALFLASGCLHYFEKPLEEILASLEELPRRVLINRTPGAEDEDVITIQDNNSYFVPSIIHSDTRLIESLKKPGYHLRSSWPVHERCLWLPLYPDRSYPFYWGFYFVRERQDALPVARRLLDVASCMISAWLAPEFVSLASQCLACA